MSELSIVKTTIVAVMVNWNGKAYLQKSISSVLRELVSHHGELLLIDNASTDGSVDFVRENFPNVTILEMGKNLGGAGGFSAGMRAALQSKKCEFIWLLDNDIVVEPNALSPLLDCLKTTSYAGAAGSQICLYDKPDTIQEIGARLTPWLGGLQQCFSGQRRLTSFEAAFEVDYLAACSILIRRSCLEQTGVFGDFFIFYDDVEWGLRAKREGWSLWGVPASVIRHQYSAIKPIIAWREYYRKRNRLALLAVYSPRYGGVFASLIYLAYLNYTIYFHKWHSYPDLYYAYLWARNDALIGRMGKRDLSSLSSAPVKVNIECLADFDEILLDIGEGPGEALILMEAIRQSKPNTIFYIPKYLAHYLKFINIQKIHLLDQHQYSAVILGKNYKLKSATSALTVFCYSDGNLIRISKIDLLKDVAIRFFALLTALSLTPTQWTVLLFKFKRT
ncbi:glycosyltransferase family 2 protein [Methylomonas sp. UP202]|uniref:glycosyltransferase family 2 protein n=1 Tax=Methylomonas sp. UP202 TaxID=3040943 RepID=UPI002478B0E2|nr:glycosyltransferase family 2 protein [Methylomonas sp. UP202]WGS83781.1 glycosyltransferase family 2 protein [Methylomonas sp. UP202]